jgi:signal transduction histidine kinase
MLDDNKQDLPNFAAWSNKNLADFATESYIRMQEQQESIEQAQQDLKDAMSELRKLVIKQS